MSRPASRANFPGPGGQTRQAPAIKGSAIKGSPAKAPPVYVLPTRFGAAFVLVGLLTLLGCVNYLLSLGYALTFLLLSVWVVCAVHASRALTRLAGANQAKGNAGLDLTLPGRVFAGQLLELHAALALPERAEAPVGVRLGQALIWLDPQAAEHTGGSLTGTLRLPPLERGPQRLPTLRLEAHDPLGLWRSSVYPEGAGLPTQLLIFPAPELGAPPPPASAAQATVASTRRAAGEEEVHGLREYRPGDAPRRIAWKQGARSDTLLTRVYDAPEAAELALDWQATLSVGQGRLAQAGPAAGTEARLSRLCAWVLEAERQSAVFSLSLPSARLERGSGEAHVRRALELLARFERSEPGLPARRRWPWMPSAQPPAVQPVTGAQRGVK
jgi:uncharacterized protein (DUF58 family)